MDGAPNGAMIDQSGCIWFCDSGRGEIRKFDPVHQTFQTVCNDTIVGNRLKRPNDLIFDKAGNLLFSDPADGREEPLSTICVLPNGKSRAKVISANKYFTNGLALGSNARTLIFAETYRKNFGLPSGIQLCSNFVMNAHLRKQEMAPGARTELHLMNLKICMPPFLMKVLLIFTIKQANKPNP